MPDTRPTDADWAAHARQMRAAVIRLRGGHPEKINRKKRCLPGEPGDCGESNVAHIIGWYAQLTAIMDHNLMHLAGSSDPEKVARAQEMFQSAYEGYICTEAADPDECSHWAEMHESCPGPERRH